MKRNFPVTSTIGSQSNFLGYWTILPTSFTCDCQVCSEKIIRAGIDEETRRLSGMHRVQQAAYTSFLGCEPRCTHARTDSPAQISHESFGQSVAHVSWARGRGGRRMADQWVPGEAFLKLRILWHLLLCVALVLRCRRTRSCAEERVSNKRRVDGRQRHDLVVNEPVACCEAGVLRIAHSAQSLAWDAVMEKIRPKLFIFLSFPPLSFLTCLCICNFSIQEKITLLTAGLYVPLRRERGGQDKNQVA